MSRLFFNIHQRTYNRLFAIQAFFILADNPIFFFYQNTLAFWALRNAFFGASCHLFNMWFIPSGKVAVRIAVTSVKVFSHSCAFFYNFSLYTFWTIHI